MQIIQRKILQERQLKLNNAFGELLKNRSRRKINGKKINGNK